MDRYVTHVFFPHYGTGWIRDTVGNYAIVEWDGVKASSFEAISNLRAVGKD